MENLQKEIEKEILNLQRSFFFGKRPMSLCFEIKETTEEVAKKWLSIVDSILEIHFVQKKLREIGWCIHYILDKRTIVGSMDKSNIIEFYCFNSSPNRFNQTRIFEVFSFCNCLNCIFFLEVFK